MVQAHACEFLVVTVPNKVGNPFGRLLKPPVYFVPGILHQKKNWIPGRYQCLAFAQNRFG